MKVKHMYCKYCSIWVLNFPEADRGELMSGILANGKNSLHLYPTKPYIMIGVGYRG
jgi:hypothetical protein